MVEDALVKIRRLVVAVGVTNIMSFVVTPVAVQLADSVELAATEPKSTTQVPKRRPATGEPSPMETAVLEALNLGVFTFACGTKIAVVEAREFVVSTSRIGLLAAFFTANTVVLLEAGVTVSVPVVDMFVPSVVAATTTPAVSKIATTLVTAICSGVFVLKNCFILI